VCSGADVVPGDVVVADDDGVMIVPRGSAARVLAEAKARIAKEKATRERLQAGDLGLDFYGLRDKLDDLGTRWVGTAEDV